MNASYRHIADALSELKQRANAGDWETATNISGMVNRTLRSEQFPPATPEDRTLLEQSLADIADVLERAGPLHQDIATLLAAFNPPPPPHTP